MSSARIWALQDCMLRDGRASKEARRCRRKEGGKEKISKVGGDRFQTYFSFHGVLSDLAVC